MDFAKDFADIVLLTLWVIVAASFLALVFRIITDLFRDRTTSVPSKVLWVALIVLLPILGALSYLIVRGKTMAERDEEVARLTRKAQVEYTRGLLAEAQGPEGAIHAAHQLLLAGAITNEEYAALKRRVMGSDSADALAKASEAPAADSAYDSAEAESSEPSSR